MFSSRIVGYLLTCSRKISQTVVLPFGSADLRFHAGRDVLSKHPHLGAFAHEGVSKEQPQLTLLWVVVTEKLWEQQMRRNRDVSGVHGKAAVPPGVLHISGHLSGIGRADVDDRRKARRARSSFSILVRAS